jgi:hypothetical protein
MTHNQYQTYRVKFSAEEQAKSQFDSFLEELLEEGVFWQTVRVDCTTMLTLEQAEKVKELALNSYNLTGEIVPASSPSVV